MNTTAEIVISDLLPAGTWIMLSDAAPLSLQVLVGSEAVMRVWFQTKANMTTNADGDLVFERCYAVLHQHRGRLVMDISEKHLQVVSRESAKGQMLLHDEMTRDFLNQLMPAS